MRNQRVQEGNGFLIVRLDGAPYERGVQHGAALAERIAAMRRALYQDLIYAHGRLAGRAFVGLCQVLLTIMERHIPADLRQEMRGVVAGARAPYRDILFFNCFDDLLHALVRLALLIPQPARARLGLACSAFVALGERTANGSPLLGRNLDYYVSGGLLGADGIVTRTMQRHLVCFLVQPTDGQPFVSIGWPGCIGVVTGMNASGLALACLTSPVPGETPNGVPLPLLYRRMLQHCSSIAQVEALLRRSRRTIGNNLVVVAGDQDTAALFEFNARAVRRLDPVHGVLATTNHYQDPLTASLQTNWVIPNSLERLRRLASLCEPPGRLDAVAAQRFLLDTAPPETGEPDPFGCLFNPGTIYSAVLSPRDRRLWLRANDRPGRAFVELDLAPTLGAGAEGVQLGPRVAAPG